MGQTELASILIAETDPAQLFSLTEQLDRQGYHTLAARDAAEAVAIAMRKRFDLLITSTQLADATGRELACQLAAGSPAQDFSLLFLCPAQRVGAILRTPHRIPEYSLRAPVDETVLLSIVRLCLSLKSSWGTAPRVPVPKFAIERHSAIHSAAQLRQPGG